MVFWVRDNTLLPQTELHLRVRVNASALSRGFVCECPRCDDEKNVDEGGMKGLRKQWGVPLRSFKGSWGYIGPRIGDILSKLIYTPFSNLGNLWTLDSRGKDRPSSQPFMGLQAE